jgi:hypothetical protein
MTRGIFRLTVDVENYESSSSNEYFRVLYELLDRLSALETRATFFVNGSSLVNKRDCELIREIAHRGHEVGSHGTEHKALFQQSAESLKTDLTESFNRIADVAGTPPTGYRAPYFSLTRKTLWAPEIILNCGFSYSSSVLPSWNPQFGLPTAPRKVFRWSCGLVEFPVPVLGLGALSFPLLGGGYIRLIPQFAIGILGRFMSNRGDSWTYVHPYDLSEVLPVHVPSGVMTVANKLISARRKDALNRYLRLLSPTHSTFADLIADNSFVQSLTSFSITRDFAG